MVVVMTIVLFGLCVCVCVFFAQWWAVGSCLCLKFFGVFFPPLPWWWWLAIGCGFLFMFFFLIGGGGWWQQVWVAEKREMLAMSMGEKRKRRRIR